MRGKSRLFTVIFVIALTLVFLGKSFAERSLAGEPPCIFIEPELTGAQPGEQFSLNVTVANAVLLWGYQVSVSFSPIVLKVVRVTEGNFLRRSTYNNTFWLPKWNNTLGLLQVWEALVAQPPAPPPPEASGSGELFQVTFRVKGFGSCLLHLHQTDMTYHDGSSIPHTTLDGIFTNLPSYVTQEIRWEADTFNVRIFSSSTISPVAFDQPQKIIYFNVTGVDGTEGYALISIPLMLLRAPTAEWQSTIDTTPLSSLILNDSNYTFFYMEYMHSSHEIRIAGTEAIPEVNLTAILAVMIFSAVALVILARKTIMHARR